MNKEFKDFLRIITDVAKDSCEVKKAELKLKQEEKAKREADLRLKIEEQNRQNYIVQNSDALKKFMAEALTRTRLFNIGSVHVENIYTDKICKDKYCWCCRVPFDRELNDIELRKFKTAFKSSVAELTKEGIHDFKDRILGDKDLIQRENRCGQGDLYWEVNWAHYQQDYQLFYELNFWKLYRVDVLAVGIDKKEGYLCVAYDAFDENVNYYMGYNFQNLICS